MDWNSADFNQLFGTGNNDSPIMMLIWILPVIIFIFYGQRIQLQVTSGEIKKNINKLEEFKNFSKSELVNYIKNNLKPQNDPVPKIDRFVEYFSIMPVDMDPGGIVPKVRHIMRTREDFTRKHVESISSGIDEIELSKVQTLLEIATSLNMIHKIINHMFLTAKKQNNYPLILPLQMMLPFIMEEAEAMKEAISAFKQGQPIGDSIGPMVVGKLMLDKQKTRVAFQTIYAESDFEGRKLYLLKAEGPLSSVGRPGEAVEKIFSENKVDYIIMVDASLKMEGEKSATISHGFGAAIGGIGTERFQIEEVATKHGIPIFAIVIKESVKEAITLMTKDIAEKANQVREQVFDVIKENTKPGQSILLIGVGNTIGVPQ